MGTGLRFERGARDSRGCRYRSRTLGVPQRVRHQIRLSDAPRRAELGMSTVEEGLEEMA